MVRKTCCAALETVASCATQWHHVRPTDRVRPRCRLGREEGVWKGGGSVGRDAEVGVAVGSSTEKREGKIPEERGAGQHCLIGARLSPPISLINGQS